MAGFKKKPLAAERVTAVEIAASSAQIVGDPRLGAASFEPAVQAPMQQLERGPEQVGSSQEFPTKYQVGMVYEIPIPHVNSNPLNPRAIYTTTAVDDMAQSLSTGGQRVSATGYIGDQGEVVLIEGETRLRGARAAGLPTLRIEIRPRPASDRELYEDARAANVERHDQSSLDDAIKWRELLTKKVYPTQVALAKALNLGEDHVSRTLSLASLPNRIIYAVAENPELLSHKMLNAIREFWEIKGDDDTLELILEAAKSGLGYRDVVTRRKAAAKGPVKRPRSTREMLSFRGAKGEIKSFEEDGRIEFTLKGLSPEAAADAQAKILALFPKEPT